MCGIVGAVKLRGTSTWRLSPDVCAGMMRTLSYRGPDGMGDWTSPDGNCWLGHTRLAIIDRAGGHQPMANEDGTIWVVLNGEIYNYLELRRELLRHHTFKTHSDTEVILHLYEELGERCLERLNGMFAFAVWDSRRQQLFAARDRLGIKPLYWHHAHGRLAFASEPKAFFAAGLWLKSRRRQRFRPPVVVYSLACVPLAVLVLLLQPSLLRWAPAFAPFLVVGMVEAARRRDRSLLSGAATTLAAAS